jgi:hypothetical protein
MVPFTFSLAGALLCNSIPHLAAGLRGEAFPTPFAKPRGKGLSPAFVNFLWGAANLFTGIFIVARRLPRLEHWTGPAFLATGFLVSGSYLSWHFAKVRRAREAGLLQAT